MCTCIIVFGWYVSESTFWMYDNSLEQDVPCLSLLTTKLRGLSGTTILGCCEKQNEGAEKFFCKGPGG